ncbi:RDD family protein [Brevibacillus dissolubilis]|uniref:RDD family protein n=1 Tax=Brevibacillus dissolubilis TaxID=1844116 RepID=UPI0011163F1F|nr:RDD family protein [Brevibacillus dissolubilis]
MNQHQVNSNSSYSYPQATVQYAGFWRRVGAYVVDGIILFIVGFIVGLLVGIVAAVGGLPPEFAAMLSNLISAVVSAVYFAAFEASEKQGTLGKQALGIKVTDLNGNQISTGQAVGRYFSKILSGLILMIGYLMVGFTEKKQGLHDKICSTVVVKK